MFWVHNYLPTSIDTFSLKSNSTNYIVVWLDYSSPNIVVHITYSMRVGATWPQIVTRGDCARAAPPRRTSAVHRTRWLYLFLYLYCGKLCFVSLVCNFLEYKMGISDVWRLKTFSINWKRLQLISEAQNRTACTYLIIFT